MVNQNGSKILWIRRKIVEDLQKLHGEYNKRHHFGKEPKFGTFVNDVLEHILKTHDLLKEIEDEVRKGKRA